MFKRNRLYDIIGAVITTLVASLIVENFKSVISFFNHSFEVKVSMVILTLLIVVFLTVLITRRLIHKDKISELLLKDQQIQALQTKLDEQEEVASRDRLTGAYNNNQAEKLLMNKIEKAKEKHQSFVGLLIDIDDFKRINGLYGHEAGNRVLQQVAFIIKPRSSDDVLIRYGGDEFLIFTKIGDTKENGYGLGQRLKREVSDFEFLVDNRNQARERITISCGVSEFDLTHDDRDRFLERLSLALKSAKKDQDGSDRKNFVAVLD